VKAFRDLEFHAIVLQENLLGLFVRGVKREGTSALKTWDRSLPKLIDALEAVVKSLGAGIRGRRFPPPGSRILRPDTAEHYRQLPASYQAILSGVYGLGDQLAIATKTGRGQRELVATLGSLRRSTERLRRAIVAETSAPPRAPKKKAAAKKATKKKAASKR
jgi:hypothetical protein